MSIEAMKLAMEALDSCDWDYDYDESPYKTFDEKLVNNASEALRQAIEQAEKTHTDHPARHWDRTCPACVAEAEKQEPVACVCGEPTALGIVHRLNGPCFHYTAPPKRKQDNPKLQLDAIERAYFHGKQQGIAESEAIKRLWVGLTIDERCNFVTRLHCQTINEIFDAIEAKLKEKNT